ncbi:MAG: DUF6691 family protein, partial [Gemmatimonadota bacterium]|nr:DUF6691 family protein [Gemmatimonadota bacterium]
HMYGVIGSAVVVGAVSLAILRRAGGDERPYRIADKERTPVYARYWGGGICFGLGWGLLGACPGPIYTLIGGGVTVAVIALAAALAGTLAYAALERALPH